LAIDDARDLSSAKATQEQIEEVPAIGEAVEPQLDDPKEWVQRLEVVEVVDRGHGVEAIGGYVP